MYIHVITQNGHEPGMEWTTGDISIVGRQIIRPSLVPTEVTGIISPMRQAKYVLWINAPVWEWQRISRIESRLIEGLSTNLYYRVICEDNPNEDKLMPWQYILWQVFFTFSLVFCWCRYLLCHKFNTSYLRLSIRFMLAATIWLIVREQRLTLCLPTPWRLIRNLGYTSTYSCLRLEVELVSSKDRFLYLRGESTQ
jgi:hypothetical protein